MPDRRPISASCRFRLAGTIAVTILVGGSPLLAKRRDDVVILTNGDKMTGEVKKLSKGVLYFKADYMADSVQINWAKVQRLTSSDEYNVSLANGARLKGVIEQGRSSVPGGSDFTIVAAKTTMRVRPPEVVEFAPVEDTFLHQLTGSIDYGFSFTGGNDATQSSLSAASTYRTETSLTQVSGTSVFNAQSGAKTSGRNTFSFDYLKSVSPRWYAGALVDLLNSQQQDLTFRSSFGGGMARDLINEGTTSFRVLGGLVFTRERYSIESGGSPRQNNAEGVLQFDFNKQTFRTMQLEAVGTVFPSITIPGRVRFAASSGLSLEIYRNLFWKVSIYENYDTRPPVAAPKNDFGTSTSVGWKF